MVLRRFFVAVAALALSPAFPAGVTAAARPAPAHTVVLADGLRYLDLRAGHGRPAASGDRVTVDYVGKLDNGTTFDSSRRSGQPFSFTLGQRQVIAGWDEGVAGMRVGGIRRLTIPASLGYGSAGAGGVIPPNARLHFDVELHAIGG